MYCPHCGCEHQCRIRRETVIEQLNKKEGGQYSHHCWECSRSFEEYDDSLLTLVKFTLMEEEREENKFYTEEGNT